MNKYDELVNYHALRVPLRGEYEFLIQNLTNKDVISDEEITKESVELIQDISFAVNELGFALGSKPVQSIYSRLKPLLEEAKKRGWQPDQLSVAYFGMIEAAGQPNTTEN